MAARFSAFCARLLPHHEASQIGQISLPLIPGPPTDLSLPRKEMIRLVQTLQTLGDTWTVITGDQAIYELAAAIRDRHKDEFPKVVLLFGGFHQAHNYLKAICKILRDSGVEELLVSARMCRCSERKLTTTSPCMQLESSVRHFGICTGRSLNAGLQRKTSDRAKAPLKKF